MNQPMSAPRFILRCFVLLGIASGLAVFVGPNDALQRMRLPGRPRRRRARQS